MEYRGAPLQTNTVETSVQHLVNAGAEVALSASLFPFLFFSDVFVIIPLEGTVSFSRNRINLYLPLT